MKSTDEPVMGQAELATLFRVTTKTIQTWDRQGLRGARVGTEAKYNAAEAVAWALERAKGDDPKERAQLRKLEAEARRVELEVRTAERALIPVTTHTSRLAEVLVRLRARLLAAPGAWAPRLVGLKTVPEALQRTRDLVNELLEALNAAADEVIPEGADARDPAA